MRIHRLTLTHIKGVADREVVFPDEGIVVVEGANEAGKTTMIEALDLLFEEKDSSRKRHVLAMRPVGLDVPSAVEVEATSGPYRFTYRKQWFRRPGTVLTVHTPRREDLTGSAAHDRARDILAETTDPDLWRALRLMQATPLGATDLSGSTALADALEGAAGQSADSAGAEGDSLLRAAEDVFREFFTATGRPTGEYRDAELRVEEARHLRDEAEKAVEEVAADVARHAEAVRELDRLDAQVAAGEAALQELQDQWASAEEVLREAERLGMATQVARQSHAAAAERVEARDALVAEVTILRDAVGRFETDLDELSTGLGPAQAALASATEEAERAHAARKEARRAASRAESDVALVADLHDLAVLAERSRSVDLALERRERAREDARARRFTGSRAAIEEAAREVDLARAEWRVGSAGWQLTPEVSGLEVEIDGERRTLQAECSGVLGDTVEIVLPGVARLRLNPPSGVAERGRIVDEAQARLAELLTEAGVDDIAAARAAAAAHDDAVRALEEAERALSGALSGESVEGLRDRVAHLHEHTVELLTRRIDEAGTDTAGAPTAPAAAGELTELDLAEIDLAAVTPVLAWITGTDDADGRRRLRTVATEAREREDAAEALIARWDAEATTLRGAVEAERLAVARAEVALASARTALGEASSRLALDREKASDAALAERVRETEALLAEATEREQTVAAEVARHDPESLRVRLEGAESAAVSLRGRFADTRDERLAIEARLRHAGGQGRAERLTEAESALARAERALASYRRRAGAARTLFHTLTRHRNEVVRTYVEPFGKEVSRLGRIVYGPDFEVEVGPSLAIEARVLADERIPYEALSSGAKEQMSILTRLACASLVDPEHGAPVILDDALGYSDPARLQRVCSAFSLVGGGAQIILLTCTPGRYAGIPDAKVIRI